MYKLGNFILMVGVLLFFVAGFGLLTNLIEISNRNISLIAAMALIFVSTGSSVKKRYR
jgi:Kef-type K+ transport system membrane component KefB